MNADTKFFFKVLRNVGVLSLLQFGVAWATGPMTWELLKPILLFCIAYTGTELLHRFGIAVKKENKFTMMLF